MSGYTFEDCEIDLKKHVAAPNCEMLYVVIGCNGLLENFQTNDVIVIAKGLKPIDGDLVLIRCGEKKIFDVYLENTFYTDLVGVVTHVLKQARDRTSAILDSEIIE